MEFEEFSFQFIKKEFSIHNSFPLLGHEKLKDCITGITVNNSQGLAKSNPILPCGLTIGFESTKLDQPNFRPPLTPVWTTNVNSVFRSSLSSVSSLHFLALIPSWFYEIKKKGVEEEKKWKERDGNRVRKIRVSLYTKIFILFNACIPYSNNIWYMYKYINFQIYP